MSTCEDILAQQIARAEQAEAQVERMESEMAALRLRLEAADEVVRVNREFRREEARLNQMIQAGVMHGHDKVQYVLMEWCRQRAEAAYDLLERE